MAYVWRKVALFRAVTEETWILFSFEKASFLFMWGVCRKSSYIIYCEIFIRLYYDIPGFETQHQASFSVSFDRLNKISGSWMHSPYLN